jgi:hypothetical protein
MATDIPPFGMSLLQINAVSWRFRDWRGICCFGGAGRAVYQVGFAEFESWVSSVAVALSFKPGAASCTTRAVLSDSQLSACRPPVFWCLTISLNHTFKDETCMRLERRRRSLIHRADQLNEAANKELTERGEGPPTLAIARRFERAAAMYAKATLGEMARSTWRIAGVCYAARQDTENANRCMREADQIPTYEVNAE